MFAESSERVQSIFRLSSELLQRTFRSGGMFKSISNLLWTKRKVKSGKLKEEEIAGFIPAFNEIEEFKKNAWYNMNLELRLKAQQMLQFHPNLMRMLLQKRRVFEAYKNR